MQQIGDVLRPLVTDVIMRNVSQEDSRNSLIAAQNAAGCDIGFMGFEEAPHLCNIVCNRCDTAWWNTRTAFYAQHPFGCPVCGDEEKREKWEHIANSEFRVKTPAEIQSEMLPKVKRAIYTFPEKERGPLFGRCKQIERDGADAKAFRWMREMLEPEAELVE